jgi:ParB family transcriptional regulator, chromosome partitioning protein
MRLEFHQLDRPFEQLRARSPERYRRLLASLADAGQQTPIVVVAAEQPSRYLVIDGYKRLAGLRQLGRDTVEAVVWPMSESEALVLERSLRLGEHETALEQGWLLAELEQRFDYDLDELAKRFDKSVSWVSRRLALVELLPETIQQQVREGKLAANLAMKYLVPVARVSQDDCLRMAEAFISLRCGTRDAAQLYAAWRDGSPAIRKRILDSPELFLKTLRRAESKPVANETAELLRDLDTAAAIVNRASRRYLAAAPEMDHAQAEQARYTVERARNQLEQLARRMEKERQHADESAANHDSGTGCTESESARDCAGAQHLAADSTQSSPVELFGGSGSTSQREGRTLPAADPGSLRHLQGESRASP